MLTANNRFGLIATQSHISEPSALRYGMFFISSMSWAFVGQLSFSKISLGENRVDAGIHSPILKCLIIHLQYTCQNDVIFPEVFLVIHIPNISFAFPRSLISQLLLSCAFTDNSPSKVDEVPKILSVQVNIMVSSSFITFKQIWGSADDLQQPCPSNIL